MSRLKTAIIHYLNPAGEEKTWSIGAADTDTDQSLKAHLKRWFPACTYQRFEFVAEPEEGEPS